MENLVNLSAESGQVVVLIAEDEPLIRNIVASALRQAGFSTLTGANGREAIELSEKYPGHIDLLLTDIAMPEVNGLQAAARIMAKRAAIKVLFMSGYAAGLTNVQGMPVLQKPFTPAVLRSKVREVLGIVAIGITA
jgi:CheY-like chemotaxis protein